MITLGNPTPTRVITENPAAEGCNTTWLRDNLGTEQGAHSSPKFPDPDKLCSPDSADSRVGVCYVRVEETLW